MSSNNNICQGLSNFSIISQQKLSWVWNNGQNFDKIEEPLCQVKLFETKSSNYWGWSALMF